MKRFWIVFLIMLLSLSVVACGKGGGAEESTVDEVALETSAMENLKESELVEEVDFETTEEVSDETVEDSASTEEPIEEATEEPTEEPTEELLEEVVAAELTDEELAEKVGGLDWAQNVNQVVLAIEKEDSRARFLYLEKLDGQFEVIYTTLAWIGSNGLGKTMEGDCKTPAGVYTLSHPFGRNDDPGCQIPYVKLDDSWYWVEDGNSQYYNQMVTTSEVEMDWTEAEQLNKFGYSYNYSIAIDFNKDRVPGVGSAIFLHCTHNSPTRGCVAIEEELMVGILQRVQDGAMIALYPDEDSIK